MAILYAPNCTFVSAKTRIFQKVFKSKPYFYIFVGWKYSYNNDFRII